ncbi:hypothetical protein D8674_021236 [Pyrus ussuriensis x Pyrus communis]|uniref:Uncharacterized protein n=1 Tax=Pyrus ussuriensis x Pyrus communis TaxID=2448454 RepID=A0A5N5GH53_9ROSA|nr:hypothetical protein D8674_021236 [Pyrus ussuriensis x Pyrus communis]
MDNGGNDSILFFPLSPIYLVGFYVSISCADRQIRFWWVSGFCGDRRRSTVSGLRVLLDFRKFH